jgi:8-oxo-dGTP pyrophosphatase MutT (NUDIX family)
MTPRRSEEGGLAPWKKHGTKPGPDLLIARARFDLLENPRTGARLERLVLEVRDWVNVVALTPARELVVVRQYRFGTGAFSTEIPGGVVDPGEEHADAAHRELREESGYTSARWSYLGAVEPNPAFQDNLCHHWLAEDARLTHALELDPGEDIEVGLLPLDEAVERVRAGTIRHSLVVSALSRIADLSLLR